VNLIVSFLSPLGASRAFDHGIMPGTSLHPAACSRDTVESLFAKHRLDRPYLYWWLLAACASGLTAMPLVSLDVSISASGRVRSRIERCEVQTPIAGLIAQVLARDNDRVQAGQPLVLLQSRDIDERLARNQAVQAEHRERIADLKAATPVGGQNRPPGASPAADLPPVEGFLTPAFRQEFLQFLASLETTRLARENLRTAFERTALLAARGITTRREVDTARYELDRGEAETALLIQQASARWQTRLQEEQTALDTLASEEKRLQEERALHIIRAPAAGVLLDFIGLNAGVFVLAGQTLGALSPDDSLVIEALIPPRDAGLIRLGQPVKIQIDAYPYAQWGALDGEVAAIAEDASPVYRGTAGGAAFFQFKVIIHPTTTALRLPSGLRGELKKGLTVQTRFFVVRRSLLRLLYDDVRSSFDPHPVPAYAAAMNAS
jgi:membrane fusion protein, peptide pheromone/bacteriocin exporter